MTILIGIHQHQEKVDKLYENLGLHAAPLTAVGPFPTKGEALTWQRDIQKKLGIVKSSSQPAPKKARLHGIVFLRKMRRN